MLPPAYPSLADVLDRHNLCVIALEQRQRQGPAALAASPEFAGMSYREILAALAAARDELEAYGVMFLVAAAEADLRRDLAARDARAKGDPVRASARQFALDTDGRPRLDALVDFWREQTGETGHGPGSSVKALLKRRHWLAHGRSWSDKSGMPIDVPTAWTRAVDFYACIRRVDAAFPRRG